MLFFVEFLQQVNINLTLIFPFPWEVGAKNIFNLAKPGECTVLFIVRLNQYK